MRYLSNGEMIEVGDPVIVEGGVRGRVVCDYDRRNCLDGYERWLTTKTLVGGGNLSSGIMVETNELGFLHYPVEDVEVCRDDTFSRPSTES